MKLYFVTLVMMIVSQTIDYGSSASILSIMKQMSSSIMTYYDLNPSNGLIAESSAQDVTGFQWYEGGIMWFLMFDYIAMSEDLSRTATIADALSIASNQNVGSFLGANQAIAALTGKWNDDIAWWAMGTTLGASLYVKDALLPSNLTYLQVSINTFLEMWSDSDSLCGGGIYWSRNRDRNNGYKSSITNIQAMWLGAHLTILTGDSTHVEKSIQIYNWLRSSGVVSDQFQVFDGAATKLGCSVQINEFSYKAGMLMLFKCNNLRSALSKMSKATGQQTYMNDAHSVLRRSIFTFTTNNIASDACEPSCKLDQVSPKGLYVMDLGLLYEDTNDQQVRTLIRNVLESSLRALVSTCDKDWYCGDNWALGTLYSPSKSVHFQMNALQLVTAFYKTFGFERSKNLRNPVTIGSSTVTSRFLLIVAGSSTNGSTGGSTIGSTGGVRGDLPIGGIKNSGVAQRPLFILCYFLYFYLL